MSMVIQHNIPALQTYNIVNSTSNALQKSIAKLSSGLRINSAADDAAGLAISEKMRSQIRGLDRAVANTQDGISMIQTAEGALSETHSILQRMRELSVQAANDTLTQQDRAYIQEEVDQLKDEITRVGNTTQFNKKKLLNGESSALWSSSDLETKALIRGSLRETDQFGQKKSIEGNYKIRVKADPGQAEVQKSDIMTIKHPNVLTDKTVNSLDGVKDVQVDNMTPGTYKMQIGQDTAKYSAASAADSTAQITGSYGFYDSSTTVTYTDSASITFANHDTSTTPAGTAWANDINGVVISFDGKELWKMEDDTTAIFGRNDTDVADQITWFTDDTFGASGDQTLVQVLNAQQATIDAGITFTKLAANADGTGIDIEFTSSKSQEGKTVKIDFERYASSAFTSIDNLTDNTVEGAETVTTVDKTKTGTADQCVTVTSSKDNIKNGSVLFEVINRDADNGTVTLKATATVLDQNGKNTTATMDNIVLTKNPLQKVDLTSLFYSDDEIDAGQAANSVTINLKGDVVEAMQDSAKFIASVTASKAVDDTNQMTMNISGKIDEDWDDTWTNGPLAGKTVTYLLDGDELTNTEVHFKNFILNEKTGTVSEGDIAITTDKLFSTDTANGGVLTPTTTTGSITKAGPLGTDGGADTDADGKGDTLDGDVVASFTTAYIGKTANGDVKLRDLDKFWNSEGKFMLDDAKTLTLNQGNGNKATITLYANDTLDEVATKINNAIATDLGQSKYVDDATKFATFVSKDDSDNSTNFASEAVPGTFVIRSVVPGAQGEITFSGDQEILDALSLNTIQESKETVYSVDVLDEHTGKVLAQNVKTTGNVMYGVINENVDVEFSALSGVSATWNNNLNKFTYTSKMEESTLHIADNTTVLQIGANEGEDLAMDIGDMRSHALGLDGVNMMSHDRAARSITIIDNAIDKVSTQRAKLGAYQNRLEYTANNLTTASENLTSAESRIRDADMAKEMMQFTKLNIMLQAGNSMLAQANQQPQNVLSLIR